MVCNILKKEFSVKKFSFNLQDDGSFNKSWVLPQWALMLVRLVMAVFCVTITIISGVREGSAKWLIYLTNWGLVLLTMAVLGLSLLSVIHMIQGTDNAQKKGEQTRDHSNVEKQTWYQKFVWFLWIVSSNGAIIVTLNYWILVFKPPTDFMGIAVHALNTVVMLIELFLGAIPVRLLHLVYVIAFASVYSVFVVVYWAAGGTNSHGHPYIYKVLDFSGNPGTAVGALFGTLLVLPVLVQFLLFGVYQLRCSLKSRSVVPTL